MISLLFKCILVIVILLVLLGFGRTWQLEHSAGQTLFTGGTLPSPAPDGFYNGIVAGPHGSWLGKKFNVSEQNGVNLFDTGNGTKAERYSFKTFSGKGMTDKNLDVLKVDYNIAANPFWLRPILDEIVQVAPDHYLGKLQVRLIPGYPFTLAFFELKR